MRKPSYLAWKLLGFALFGAALVAGQIWNMPCPLRLLTGRICPFCGMSRAWRAALRLDLGAAFGYHPMFWIVPVAGLYVLFDGRLCPKPWQDALVLGALGVAFAACYGVRLWMF